MKSVWIGIVLMVFFTCPAQAQPLSESDCFAWRVPDGEPGGCPVYSPSGINMPATPPVDDTIGHSISVIVHPEYTHEYRFPPDKLLNFSYDGKVTRRAGAPEPGSVLQLCAYYTENSIVINPCPTGAFVTR